MKKISLILLFAIVSPLAFGKIVQLEDKLFLRDKGKQIPLSLVNDLIQKKSVSKVKLYLDGNVRMVSFAKDNGKEKIHSVDEKGFVYAIEPFASYEVKEVDENGRITFKEVPNRRYKVSSQGYFFY